MEAEEDLSAQRRFFTFRRSISHFPTGVAVISCGRDLDTFHGVTVNSLTSISLSPPSLMISLRPGRAREGIVKQGSFGVSLLKEDQRPVAMHFAGNPKEELRETFVIRDKVPTLRDCIGWLECDVELKIEHHDHTLIFGRVTSCDFDGGAPLIFFGGKFRASADVFLDYIYC